MIIGIGNVGSTSLKSKIIDINNKNEVRVLGEANIDKIKTRGASNFTHRVGDEPLKKDVIRMAGFDSGIKYILKWFVRNKVIESPAAIEAMGFKCILGEKNGANMLTPKILEEMEKFLFVAPVHNQPYIETIGYSKEYWTYQWSGFSNLHFTGQFRIIGEYPDYPGIGMKKAG